jgi:hypothetical protein
MAGMVRFGGVAAAPAMKMRQMPVHHAPRIGHQRAVVMAHQWPDAAQILETPYFVQRFLVTMGKVDNEMCNALHQPQQRRRLRLGQQRQIGRQQIRRRAAIQVHEIP